MEIYAALKQNLRQSRREKNGNKFRDRVAAIYANTEFISKAAEGKLLKDEPEHVRVFRNVKTTA